MILNGSLWRVVRVSPGDPFLIDRTGFHRVATTDPIDKIIRISTEVLPPALDKVLIHEVSHAIMEENHVPDLLAEVMGEKSQHLTEELLAWFLENHSIETLDAVSRSLGRMVCVDNLCTKGETR